VLADFLFPALQPAAYPQSTGGPAKQEARGVASVGDLWLFFKDAIALVAFHSFPGRDVAASGEQIAAAMSLKYWRRRQERGYSDCDTIGTLPVLSQRAHALKQPSVAQNSADEEAILPDLEQRKRQQRAQHRRQQHEIDDMLQAHPQGDRGNEFDIPAGHPSGYEKHQENQKDKTHHGDVDEDCSRLHVRRCKSKESGGQNDGDPIGDQEIAKV
jgi:hypothetical protein